MPSSEQTRKPIHENQNVPPSTEEQIDVTTHSPFNFANFTKQLQRRPDAISKRDLLQLQRLVGNQKSLNLLNRQPKPAIQGQSPVRIQRELDKKPSMPKFMDDLEVPDSKRTNIQSYLSKLLNYASELEFRISYDWLVEWTKGKLQGLNYNFKRTTLDTLQEALKKAAGQVTDERLSGEGGHMFGRHVLIDSEFQERRLRDEGRQQATRIDESETSLMMQYLRDLQKTMPSKLRKHFSDVAWASYRSINDENRDTHQDFTRGNNQAKRNVIRGVIVESTQGTLGGNGNIVVTDSVTDDFIINFVWTVRIDNGNVALTCAPEVEILEDFEKIESTLQNGEYTETEAQGHTNMYWGRNAPTISISQGMPQRTFTNNLGDIDFQKLGVTNF